MPIYEYKCADCNSQFESIRPMSQADAEIACKTCSSKNTTRLLSVCYSKSDGHSSTHSHGSGGCGNCSGGSCGSCGH